MDEKERYLKKRKTSNSKAERKSEHILRK